MGSVHLYPTVRQPPTKPSLMGLSVLCPALDINSKSIEMDILALDHANHHPAQGLEVASVAPLDLTLTEIIIQRIIEAGSGCHRFRLICVVTDQPNLASISLLAFISRSKTFVSQAGFDNFELQLKIKPPVQGGFFYWQKTCDRLHSNKDHPLNLAMIAHTAVPIFARQQIQRFSVR